MVFKLLKYGARSVGVLIFILFSEVAGLSQANLDSLLQQLNKSIKNKNVYVQAKLDRIQGLKDQLVAIPNLATEDQFDLYNKLFHEYKVFIYDSALNMRWNYREHLTSFIAPQKSPIPK